MGRFDAGSHSDQSENLVVERKYASGDLWAFGVIIYQFFTGQVPFKGKNQESTFEKIRKGLFEMPKSVPPLAQDLIRKLLTVNPELRLGTADMHDLMSHKFFDGIDFATIHD